MHFQSPQTDFWKVPNIGVLPQSCMVYRSFGKTVKPPPQHILGLKVQGLLRVMTMSLLLIVELTAYILQNVVLVRNRCVSRVVCGIVAVF